MGSTNRWRVVTAIGVVVGLLAAVQAENLPSDARIKTGTLANGLKWMYLKHDNPPGKMALMINVDSGSLNETDAQRGLAHFIEHMAFNGSENFPPGELIPYFESVGMEFGADLNAFTSFNQTAFMLFLPDTQVPTVDKALMMLSDQAFRLLMAPEEIEKERGVILSELRAGMSAQQRINDKFFERVFEGTRISQRLPIGIESVIKAAQHDDFENYYRTWYRPETVTLMLVGDADIEPYMPALEKWFGQYKATMPASAAQKPGFKPFTASRGVLLTDPEYAEGDISIYSIQPGRPPTTTVAQSRVELVEQLGHWIVGRRLADLVKKGDASFREASTSTANVFNDGLLVTASAVGEPQDWEKMLSQLTLEVSRAREFGFLPQELELAKADLLAGAERAVRTESTQAARNKVMAMNRSVNSREPLMSAQQELDLVKKLMPDVKIDEVNKAFADNFKAGAYAYVLTMPEKDDLPRPTEEAILAAAVKAEGQKPTPPTWEDRPTTLLEHEPTPGKLSETTVDEELKITSGWLSNGARFHHRFVDYKKDTVLLSITLAGGEIEETAENTGVSAVAALAFNQPATSRLKSTDVEDIMTGKNINVSAAAQGDAFTVTVAGSPVDLEIGLQLAHALLTDARIEQSAFDKWKEGSLQDYAMYSKLPQFAAYEALLNQIGGGDPRRTMMTPAKINAQSVERSQTWLNRLLKSGPIEVTVVGEIKLAEAQALVEKYVGSLAARPRSAENLDALRNLLRKPGPLEQRVAVVTMTPQAMVLCGFIGCQARDVADVRALNLAAHTLDSQLIKRIREELGLVYSIGANNLPAEVYNDSGLFVSGAPCAPDKADEVIKEVDAIFAAMAEKGPTEEELANAKKQVANNLDEEMKEPQFWFEALQHLDLHRLSLDHFRNVQAAYDACTADQVRTVFAKYYKPARQLRIVAFPDNAGSQPAADKADKQAP